MVVGLLKIDVKQLEFDEGHLPHEWAALQELLPARSLDAVVAWGLAGPRAAAPKKDDARRALRVWPEVLAWLEEAFLTGAQALACVGSVAHEKRNWEGGIFGDANVAPWDTCSHCHEWKTSTNSGCLFAKELVDDFSSSVVSSGIHSALAGWLLRQRRSHMAQAPGSSLDVPISGKVGLWSTHPQDLTDQELPAVAFLNEDLEHRKNTAIVGKQLGFYLHVDDGVFMGPMKQSAAVDSSMQSSADELETLGFVVADRRSVGQARRVIGYNVEQSPARVSLPSEKQAGLMCALRLILCRRRVHTDILATVVGVWIFGAALRRELLAIPLYVFRLLDQHRGEVVSIWPSVRRELEAMAASVPWMFLDLGQEFAPFIFATDAMGATDRDAGGYGVVATSASRDESLDLFRRSRILSYTVPKVDGDRSSLHRPDRGITRTAPRTHVAADLLRLDRWRVVDQGRWSSKDHITLGEARVVVRLVRRVVGSKLWHDRIVLSLQDNSSVAGAFGKGRSPSLPLLRLCRQKSAACLLANLRLVLPWVNTALQPADGASREEDGPSLCGQGQAGHGARDDDKSLSKID